MVWMGAPGKAHTLRPPTDCCGQFFVSGKGGWWGEPGDPVWNWVTSGCGSEASQEAYRPDCGRKGGREEGSSAWGKGGKSHLCVPEGHHVLKGSPEHHRLAAAGCGQ